jgi:uncharacterized lipoprotein YajG
VSRAAIAAGLALLALAGCASRPLEVGYPPQAARRALLGAVAPRKVVVTAVTDRRLQQDRIGNRPESGKPLVTSRPVPEIVRQALVLELGLNGHEVVTGPGDVVVTADVEDFWLDAVGGAPTPRYVGRVAIALVVAEGATGNRLLSRRYVGVTRRPGEADSRDTWRAVMDTALARTIHDVATDPDVAAALDRTAPRGYVPASRATTGANASR